MNGSTCPEHAAYDRAVHGDTVGTASRSGRPAAPDGPAVPDFDVLRSEYRSVRAFSEELCRPLAIEDYVVQSMDDVSPAKWHLGHVSWFFETFLLLPELDGYEPFHPRFSFIFNSYYNAVGERHPRPRRGVLARPTVEEVLAYRRHVDRHMTRLLANVGAAGAERVASVVEIGLHHEQQHQELMVTDFKHVFGVNPLHPVYCPARGGGNGASPGALDWVPCAGGLRWFGHAGPGFAYDNEGPRHQRFLPPYRLADRLVTNGEYRCFMADGGYRRPELWLSDGWDAVNREGWEAPLYWSRDGSDWHQVTLSGLRPIAPSEPVVHVSYFEADAYARWAGVRLPTEFEWEASAMDETPAPESANFVEEKAFHPRPCPPGAGLRQLFGDAWEWTASDYAPFPGYRPAPGALGEYNGKFMCNQYVLRGGSCATPRTHVRATYRNFFPPDKRWQFSGIRLADDG